MGIEKSKLSDQCINTEKIYHLKKITWFWKCGPIAGGMYVHITERLKTFHKK